MADNEFTVLYNDTQMLKLLMTKYPDQAKEVISKYPEYTNLCELSSIKIPYDYLIDIARIYNIPFSYLFLNKYPEPITPAISLVSFTPNPEEVVAGAANICYSSDDISKTLEKYHNSSKTDVLIDKLLNNGHLSPFEHVSFTFGLQNISRALTHQLVRHRMASYSQQSQRYVNMENVEFVIPESIKKSMLYGIYNDLMDEIISLYNIMIKNGIPKEDARYILPNATTSNIIVTMNARELMHFFELRCCSHAQWEIRDVANEMLQIVKTIAPRIFKNAGPYCVKHLKCQFNTPLCAYAHSLIPENRIISDDDTFNPS